MFKKRSHKFDGEQICFSTLIYKGLFGWPNVKKHCIMAILAQTFTNEGSQRAPYRWPQTTIFHQKLEEGAYSAQNL